MADQQQQNDVVERILALCQDFEARAELTDAGGPANASLAQNIRALADIGYYGAGVPSMLGGLGLSGDDRTTCAEAIASACGATAFTQQQLHGIGGFLSNCPSEELRAELLPKIVKGESLCGIAFAHLRRPGPPMVRVEAVADGYIVNGVAPWITAWSFLDGFILAGNLPSGEEIYFYVPIEENRPSLTVSEPQKVVALNSGDTVRVEISDLHLPARNLLAQKPANDLNRGDYCNITGHVSLPLGCATGSIRFLRDLAAKRSRANIAKAADRFEERVNKMRTESQTWNRLRIDEPDYATRALAARTGSIKVAIDAALACIAASAGAGMLLSNPAQRRLREAAFYSVGAQTLDIQNTLLETYTNGG